MTETPETTPATSQTVADNLRGRLLNWQVSGDYGLSDVFSVTETMALKAALEDIMYDVGEARGSEDELRALFYKLVATRNALSTALYRGPLSKDERSKTRDVLKALYDAYAVAVAWLDEGLNDLDND